MVGTKLRAIAWTQRRCFHGPQFTPATPLTLSRTGSSCGLATRQISARVPLRPSPRTGSTYIGRVFLLAPRPHTRVAENEGGVSPTKVQSFIQISRFNIRLLDPE